MNFTYIMVFFTNVTLTVSVAEYRFGNIHCLLLLIFTTFNGKTPIRQFKLYNQKFILRLQK
jgi:hypothetical protein